MSRMILLVLVAAVAVAVVALIISVFSDAGPRAERRSNGVQKVAYGVLVVLMFGAATGLLGDG